MNRALQVQDDELRLVSPAPVPVQSVSRWAVVVVFIGGMLGLLVGPVRPGILTEAARVRVLRIPNLFRLLCIILFLRQWALSQRQGW